MKAFFEMIGVVLISFLLYLLIGLILGVPFWLAWNYVIPYVFNLHPLTYLQSVAFVVIAQIIFGDIKKSGN